MDYNEIRYNPTKHPIECAVMLESKQRGIAMIKIHLSKVLGEKRWTQADVARLTGIRPSTINETYHEIIQRINVDHLDKLCEVLHCNVSDLLEYIPNRQSTTGKDLIVEPHGRHKK